jgi:hypothetical protein
MTEEKLALAVPAIHRNGTSLEALIEQLREAYEALGRAVVALEAASPNARDYYTQPAGVWERARVQHADRLLRIVQTQNELASIWEAIAE